MQRDLIILISHIADRIAEGVSVGTAIEVEGSMYQVAMPENHPRFSSYLTVGGERVIYGSPDRGWYESWLGIDGETRVFIESADRKDYLRFAQHWLAVIHAFSADEERIIEQIRQDFPEAWDPWSGRGLDDDVDEIGLVVERCQSIMTSNHSSDEDKEEARITVALCQLLFGDR